MENVNKNREIAIKLSGVKKKYRLGQIGGGTLRADLQSWWAKIRKKEDPNVRIGVDQRLIGQEFMALNGIDLTIYQGEAIGIIGGNGAGKSTMLKLLSRVTAPTEGEIDINGRVASMLEVGTGFNGEMTGRENIYLNGAILGMTKAEIDAKMEDIIEFSEVRDFIDTPVKRYSSGMYVKLAFSVAAHLDSEIMIMDEVLAVGDMAFQKKCLTKMREAAKEQGRTVLYVSHNMNTIRQLCDRCVVLNQGRVVFEGDVEAAIGVYMKQNEDNRISYNYLDGPQDKRGSKALKLLGLDIQNRETNRVKNTEDLEFTLHCLTKEDVQDMYIRFEISYLDDTIAGTVFTNRNITAKKGQYLDLDISFSVKNLAVGRYIVTAVVHKRDEFGRQEIVDWVRPALSFEVVSANINERVWSHRFWGHVQFDDAIVQNIKYIEKD